MNFIIPRLLSDIAFGKALHPERLNTLLDASVHLLLDRETRANLIDDIGNKRGKGIAFLCGIEGIETDRSFPLSCGCKKRNTQTLMTICHELAFTHKAPVLAFTRDSFGQDWLQAFIIFPMRLGNTQAFKSCIYDLEKKILQPLRFWYDGGILERRLNSITEMVISEGMF